MKKVLRLGRSGPVFLALGLGALPLSAQDRGVLLLRAGDREVGSESFTIRSDSSLRITARTVFGTRNGIELSATVDRGQTGEVGFQLERRGGQIYAVQKRNRITIRRVEQGAEQARELPGGPRTVMLADSVFSLFYQLVPLAEEAGPVNVLYPHGARRLSLTLERVPSAGGTLIRFSGGLAGEIQLGNHGEVLRIQLPSLGLEAVRKPD
jgi:hypothetical protein